MTVAGTNLTKLAVDIVSAYVTNNAIAEEKLPDFIGSIHAALGKASVQSGEPEEVELKPAVPVKKSVTPEYIVCLEDGLKFKSLKRHLQSHHDLTPDEYRKKWGLHATTPWWLRHTLLPAQTWPEPWGWGAAAPRLPQLRRAELDGPNQPRKPRGNSPKLPEGRSAFAGRTATSSSGSEGR